MARTAALVIASVMLTITVLATGCGGGTRLPATAPASVGRLTSGLVTPSELGPGWYAVPPLVDSLSHTFADGEVLGDLCPKAKPEVGFLREDKATAAVSGPEYSSATGNFWDESIESMTASPAVFGAFSKAINSCLGSKWTDSGILVHWEDPLKAPHVGDASISARFSLANSGDLATRLVDWITLVRRGHTVAIIDAHALRSDYTLAAYVAELRTAAAHLPS
jgi:hypothetical protein